MPFQTGNEHSKKADHKRHRVITQALIATLNEKVTGGKITKMRALVDKLIELAIDGDTVAIKEIIERVDGRVPQILAGDDGDGPIQVIIRQYVGNIPPQ